MHLTGLLQDRRMIMEQMQAAGVDPNLFAQVDRALQNADQKDLNDLLEGRLSASVYEYVKQQPVQPTTVEQVLQLVTRWIESQNKRPEPSPAINAMASIPAASPWSRTEWSEWLGQSSGAWGADPSGGSG